MKEKILGILNTINPDGDFNSSEDFFEDELLDSIGVLTMITMIEKVFSIKVRADDITADHFLNVDAIAELLENYGI